MLTRGRCLAVDVAADVLLVDGVADESNKSCWTCKISTYSSRPVVFVAFNRVPKQTIWWKKREEKKKEDDHHHHIVLWTVHGVYCKHYFISGLFFLEWFILAKCIGRRSQDRVAVRCREPAVRNRMGSDSQLWPINSIVTWDVVKLKQ